VGHRRCDFKAYYSLKSAAVKEQAALRRTTVVLRIFSSEFMRANFKYQAIPSLGNTFFGSPG
jgi:hypothetical protein